VFKLIACWSPPRPADVAAFEKHYREVHAPLATRVPHLQRIVLTRTDLGLEGGAPAFHRVAEMFFESPEALAQSAHSAAWAAMRADAGQMIERFGVSLQVAMGHEESPKPDPR
jgi:uncharacterized protein (TIGR02118 family)